MCYHQGEILWPGRVLLVFICLLHSLPPTTNHPVVAARALGTWRVGYNNGPLLSSGTGTFLASHLIPHKIEKAFVVQQEEGQKETN
jgi:hypothetical protein